MLDHSVHIVTKGRYALPVRTARKYGPSTASTYVRVVRIGLKNHARQTYIIQASWGVLAGTGRLQSWLRGYWVVRLNTVHEKMRILFSRSQKTESLGEAPRYY